MWPALRDRLKEVRAEQHKLQIHQNPMPNHPVAHLEARGSSSKVQPELVTIQHLEADQEQVPSVEESNEPDIQELCSEQGSTEWEFRMEDEET